MEFGIKLLSRTHISPLNILCRKNIPAYYVARLGHWQSWRTVSTKSLSTDYGHVSSTKSESSQERADVKELLDTAISSKPNETNPEFPSDVKDDWIKYNNIRRSQSKNAFRPKVDPRETSIVLFPGQGSQFVGMGRKLLQYPGVAEIYDFAGSILGYDLLEVCLNGPKAKLDRTVYCQPAVLVTSLAAIEKLREENPKAIENCVSTAGFSIGEYAALVFAGALTFEDALRIVKVRAEAMQEASEATPSGMMSVFLRPEAKIKYACHTAERYCRERLSIENPVCKVANYLYPEVKVIAGHNEALEFIEVNAEELGIRRTKRLPVSGAFHTDLMRPAAELIKDAIKEAQLEKPIVSVHSNVSSFRYKNVKDITKTIVQQVYKPVKWEQTMHVLYARDQGDYFPQTYEMGPGKQLGTLLRMTNGKAYQNYSPVDV